MGKVYAIANRKGGVGKTTTTFNLGAALAERGKKVLLIDIDQQGSLTLYTGTDPDLIETKNTIYHVFSSYVDTNATTFKPLAPLIQQIRPHLFYVPANDDLAALDIEIIQAYNREYILREMLEAVREQYDYIIIDCPPALSLIVVNAFVAADEIIIALQADYLATRGVKKLIQQANVVQARHNSKLHIAGILLTMADQRTIHTRKIIDATRTNFEGKVHVFDTVIKHNVRLKDAPAAHQSILEYDSESEIAEAFRKLAEQIDYAA
jgi:chromosome partitioning protein